MPDVHPENKLIKGVVQIGGLFGYLLGIHQLQGTYFSIPGNIRSCRCEKLLEFVLYIRSSVSNGNSKGAIEAIQERTDKTMQEEEIKKHAIKSKQIPINYIIASR